MKKIIYIAMLCLPFIALSQANKLSTEANLTFGRHSLDCSGRGTCSFTSPDNKQANTEIIYNKDNTLSLIIDRTRITMEDELKITGQNLQETYRSEDLTFVMEEDFEIPIEIKTKLNMSSNLIVKGTYPIQVNETHFIITITLK
ncbi:MAG: hypothetical protein GY739_04475 [Mesoflavibacter sp.]|nr:hypothetical protein [Mesoflavibacter sp.]